MLKPVTTEGHLYNALKIAHVEHGKETFPGSW